MSDIVCLDFILQEGKKMEELFERIVMETYLRMKDNYFRVDF